VGEQWFLLTQKSDSKGKAGCDKFTGAGSFSKIKLIIFNVSICVSEPKGNGFQRQFKA
jgi:hypothetical protein